MSTLFLVELTPAPTPQAATDSSDGSAQTRPDVSGLLSRLSQEAPAHSVELIEAQVTADLATVFVILEAEDAASAASATAALPATASEPAQVRLVGAGLDQVKASRPEAGYLVEWDIPAGMDMDTYLTRKAEKSPLYAQVPEVSFLRTYVREDMEKCLCLYNAPDEDAVRRARDAVSTPIDRLHALEKVES